ncbi:putative copper resistance protein D [Arthrobacter pigmenti]|uniref:Putative copper resistance protein D n=1 Tax=Arthrobacter pigmenti TaxID=271432 RepID=A0A846RIC0_9MICC|nr:CopD family protein [Arthrobacter pigmenti]NJC21440.1 putative copper resistance protein D [Arthrobacter pigmenti]
MQLARGSGASVRAQSRGSWPIAVAAAALVTVLVPVLILLISDDGGATFIGSTLPFVRALVHLTTLTAVALLCVGVLLPAPSEELSAEELSAEAQRLGRQGCAAAVIAALACVLLLFWTYFDVIGSGPFQGADLSDLGAFLNELASGRALVAQVSLLILGAVFAYLARTAVPLRMALVLVIAGTTTMGLGGHSASESGHGAAMFSMTGHIGAASLWVGGLAGLGWLAHAHPNLLRPTVARFSRLALTCAAVVGVSGVVSAVVRVESLALLPGSLYGAVLLAKTMAFIGLIVFGVLHRRRLLAQDSFTARTFLQLAAGEVLIMGVAYGLAVALVRLDPPVLL